MKTHLRVIPQAGEGAAPVDMSDALESLCRQVSASRPTAVLVFWETATGFEYRTLPDSLALARGMSDIFYDATHPPAEEGV